MLVWNNDEALLKCATCCIDVIGLLLYSNTSRSYGHRDAVPMCAVAAAKCKPRNLPCRYGSNPKDLPEVWFEPTQASVLPSIPP